MLYDWIKVTFTNHSPTEADALMEKDTLFDGLIDKEVLGMLVEEETLPVVDGEPGVDTLVEGETFALVDGETLVDTLVEGETLALVDRETLLDTLVE